jgi:hypothetical protein
MQSAIQAEIFAYRLPNSEGRCRVVGRPVGDGGDDRLDQDVFHLHLHVVPRYRDDDFERARYELLPQAIRKEQGLRLKAIIARTSS